MSLYAVGHADFFNNDLRIELILAPSENDAIRKHTALCSDDPVQDQEMKEWLSLIPDNKEEMKQFFFDSDTLVDVELIHKV